MSKGRGIVLKLNEQFWPEVMSGEKCFEIRLNDRGYQKGMLINFDVRQDNGWKSTCFGEYHKDMWFEITYVLSGWGLKENHVVFGIKKVAE